MNIPFELLCAHFLTLILQFTMHRGLFLSLPVYRLSRDRDEEKLHQANCYRDNEWHLHETFYQT